MSKEEIEFYHPYLVKPSMDMVIPVSSDSNSVTYHKYINGKISKSTFTVELDVLEIVPCARKLTEKIRKQMENWKFVSTLATPVTKKNTINNLKFAPNV